MCTATSRVGSLLPGPRGQKNETGHLWDQQGRQWEKHLPSVSPARYGRGPQAPAVDGRIACMTVSLGGPTEELSLTEEWTEQCLREGVSPQEAVGTRSNPEADVR